MTTSPQTTRLWLTVIVPFALGYFVSVALRSINAVLAHPLMEQLHLNAVEIGWVTSTFVLTFALVQVPLGILLDTWGARRTQALLFVIGGCGIIVFGLATNVMLLSIGRALLGIGMAGGLMAAIKAVSDWVDKDRVPFFNGVILAAGGIGALVATTPSKLFELEYGWRALCFTMGAVTIAIALLIFFVNRDKPSARDEHPGFREQLAGLKSVYSDRFFWQVAPLLITSLGGFIGMQGLWLGPWLQHVVGMTPLHSANYLLVIAIAMTLGFISGGLFSSLARSLKMPLSDFVAIGIAVHIVTQIFIVADYFTANYVVWFAYGYFAQVALVNYAIIAQHFGPKLSGRANTGVNMFVFLFAFATQYLFGLIIHLWPTDGGPSQHVPAYQVGLSALIVLEALALIWFFVLASARRKTPVA